MRSGSFPKIIVCEHCAIHKCRIKLSYVKKKPYVNVVQKSHCLLWAIAYLKEAYHALSQSYLFIFLTIWCNFLRLFLRFLKRALVKLPVALSTVALVSSLFSQLYVRGWRLSKWSAPPTLCHSGEVSSFSLNWSQGATGEVQPTTACWGGISSCMFVHWLRTHSVGLHDEINLIIAIVGLCSLSEQG